jgi:hypothetical protein
MVEILKGLDDMRNQSAHDNLNSIYDEISEPLMD